MQPGERIAWIIAVLIVGAAAFFGGQQLGINEGQQRRTQATQRFFAERGGQPTNGQAGGASGQNGTPAGRGENVVGVVDSVSSSGVIIKTQDGSLITIALAEGGTVRKQVDGETFQANMIQVGGGIGRTP